MQIERRLAPFWKGLNDHSESWTENQLVAAARGQPIPAPDEIPAEFQSAPAIRTEDPLEKESTNINNLTVPISSRSHSINSDSSSNPSPATAVFPFAASNPKTGTPPSGSALLRGRAKTLASLTGLSKNQQTEMTPREMNLPNDPSINGQPFEAYLYKDASECPICFLFYPPYLNKTRCCDQPICSECFVQIKRPDPHPPEHTNSIALPALSTERSDSEGSHSENSLVSEPAACPFCVQPEFGVIYDPPPFRRGLTYVTPMWSDPLANLSPAMSSSSSLASAMSGGTQFPQPGLVRRRATTISATSTSVVTTDRVRPDWHQKLAGARAQAARRSAAATALHTAAYLMGNRNHESDVRSFGSFGRRAILRRASGNDGSSVGPGHAHLSMLASLSEHHASPSSSRIEVGGFGEGEPNILSPHRGSSRRSRMDDLEEMMMMEAIRLSLVSEEERRKREEKDAKKSAKKKEKEIKKAEKVARKTGAYNGNIEPNSTGFVNFTSASSLSEDGLRYERGKGKSVQRRELGQSSETSSAVDVPLPLGEAFSPAALPSELTAVSSNQGKAHTQPVTALPPSTQSNAHSFRPSHLRELSNASASGSSTAESGIKSFNDDYGKSNSSLEASPDSSGTNIVPRSAKQDALLSSPSPGESTSIEPMFNFRSLAAMVGEDGKSVDLTQIEHANVTVPEESTDHHRAGESSISTESDSKMQRSSTTSLGNNAVSQTHEKGIDMFAQDSNAAVAPSRSPPSSHVNEDGKQRVGSLTAVEANYVGG